MVRPKSLGPLLRLERDGEAICETRISGMWTRRAHLTLGGVGYLVIWPAFDPKTILRRGEVVVGTVGKWKAWARQGDADFSESVPPILSVFVMWLATHQRLNSHG